jgi:hypothetical protein
MVKRPWSGRRCHLPRANRPATVTCIIRHHTVQRQVVAYRQTNCRGDVDGDCKIRIPRMSRWKPHTRTGILARPRLLMQRRRQRDLGRGEVKSDWRGRDRILQYTVRPTFVHHYGVYSTDTSFWTKRTLSLWVVGVKLKQSSGWAAFKPRLGNRLGLTSALSLSITYSTSQYYLPIQYSIVRLQLEFSYTHFSRGSQYSQRYRRPDRPFR